MTTPANDPGPWPAAKALVLGGGGPVGRAWLSGLAAGLLEQGIPLANADLIIGTSAGAIVGAEIALGLDLGVYGPVVDAPDGAQAAVPPPAAMQQLTAATARAAASDTPEAEFERVGAMAIAALTCTEDESLSRATFAPITGKTWPNNLRATSLNSRTGQLHAWDATSAVALERAVAASSALPNIWPPITIGDDRYYDGGIRSTLNADLATGSNRVVVVSCFSLTISDSTPPPLAARNRSLRAEVDSLRTSGSVVELIEPDDRFLRLTSNGTRMLDNALVPDAFTAGREQARAAADPIRRIWSSEQ